MTSTVQIDNKKKDILILGVTPTQRLDDTTLAAEAQYSIDFSRSNRNFYLKLHYNGKNKSFFVNATKIYHFKGKDCETRKYPLYLRNISGNISSSNMKKSRIKWVCVRFFSSY